MLDALLRDLPPPWPEIDEGPETWTVFDVVGHLIHGEHADWIPRARMILQHGTDRTFEPFDRTAQFNTSTGRTLNQLLDDFKAAREDSLRALDAFRLDKSMLALRGRHPVFGEVTLGELLATWVAHDLDHLHQVSRVLARGLGEAVGPWRAYLRVIRDPIARS